MKKKSYIEKIRKERKQLLLKLLIPYFCITVFIFCFGYDMPLFAKEKLFSFLPPFLFLLLLLIFIVCKKYNIAHRCPFCGNKIKDTKDCIRGKEVYIGTKKITEYKKVRSTIKGKTIYPRGGYSMRNASLEPTSESTYEINQEIPVDRMIYIYKVDYHCKKCNEHVITKKEERI